MRNVALRIGIGFLVGLGSGMILNKLKLLPVK
jgi:hypothetical protein